MKKPVIALIASIALASAAHAQVTVTAPWIRATVPQQKSTGAFMQLQSSSDTRLVAVATPAAGQAQMHQMEMNGQMMKMRQVDSIDLPAGKRVDLASGGYHIMLVDLKGQLKQGTSVPLSLTFEDRHGKRSTLAVKAEVKPLTYSAPAAP